MLKDVTFPGFPLGNPSGYVREEACHVIKPFPSFIVLCYNCDGTHLFANILISSLKLTHMLSEALFTSFFLMHLATHYLGDNKINTKDLFNCTVVGTILIPIIAFWLNLYYLSISWLKVPFNNFQEKLISHVDSLFQFHLCNSKNALCGLVVYRKGQCFVTDAS